jgi:chromosome segregation ATPase
MMNDQDETANLNPRREANPVARWLRSGLRKAFHPAATRLAKTIVALAGPHDSTTTRLDHADSRIDAQVDAIQRAESVIYQSQLRLDALERNVEILQNHFQALRSSVEGMGQHLEGLAQEHLDLLSACEGPLAKVHVIGRSIAGLDDRQNELDAKLGAFQALHWDHVALARRLSIIEDILASISESGHPTPADTETQPAIPFPGFDDDSRRSVG